MDTLAIPFISISMGKQSNDTIVILTNFSLELSNKLCLGRL